MRRHRLLSVLVAATGLVAAGLATTAPATAGNGGAACPTDPDAPKRQLRADWIASVVNIDWPSRPGLSPEQQQAELRAWYDQAVERGLNAVIVQVRPTADTFWPSDLEPWSRYLTGTPGGDPGYDPLQFAVEEAHKRNLEFHAWFNPYRVSMNTDRSALAPDSPAAQHPTGCSRTAASSTTTPGCPRSAGTWRT